MIDKTMCEVLWRNISDFYVNLRVEVGKHPQVIFILDKSKEMHVKEIYVIFINLFILEYCWSLI